MEPMRIELTTSSMPWKRSSQLSYGPRGNVILSSPKGERENVVNSPVSGRVVVAEFLAERLDTAH